MQTKSKKPWIIIAVVILVVLVALCAAFMSWKAGTGDGAIKKNQYQAVFLTNGQVYFCKLSSVTSTYVTCKDIYYLQVQQSVQPAEQTDANKPQVQLAKLGSELHGPEDEMQISRDQVLFWENLKDNSKVVDAIKKNTTKQ